MADLKTSELTPASALTGAELVPLVQDSGNVSATLDQVIGLVTPAPSEPEAHASTHEATGSDPLNGYALISADLAAFTSGAATSGQVPTADGAGGVDWDDVTAGDVVGPASATDDAIARFDGTTGELLQNSLVTVNDTGELTAVNAYFSNGAFFKGNVSGASELKYINNGLRIKNVNNTTVAAFAGIPASNNGDGLVLISGAGVSWKTSLDGSTGKGTLVLLNDGDYILAQRNGTSAQASRLYSTYTSATSYHRMALTCAKQTLSAVSGATVATTGGLIPAGAFLMGVTTRVNTGLGVTNGTTGYSVGNGTDPNLWGDVTAVIAGTASKAAAIAAQSSGYTASDALGLQLTAQDVTLTAVGGNFNGVGDIEISAFYFLAEAD